MAAKKTKVSRNPDLISGIGKFSRSKMYHKRGLWAIKAKHGGAFPRHDKAPVEETMTSEKPPKFYPADDVKKPLVNKRKARPTKLRSSISPGTVLIILAGRFKGKRVVFLKQLTSGLLLVTGNSRKSYHWRHCMQAPAHLTSPLFIRSSPLLSGGLVPDYLKHLNDERFCSYKN